MFNSKIGQQPTNIQSMNNVNKGLKNDKGDSGIKGWMDKQLKAETPAKASQLKSEISSYLFGNIYVSKTVYLTGSEQASNRRGIMKRFDVIAEQLQSAYQSNNNNVLQNRVKNIKQVLLEAVTECINKITTNIKFAAQKHQFDFSLDNKAKGMIKDFMQKSSNTKDKNSALEEQIAKYLTVGIKYESTNNENVASLFQRAFQLEQHVYKLSNNYNNKNYEIIREMIKNKYKEAADNYDFHTPSDKVFDKRDVINARLQNLMQQYLTGSSSETIQNQTQALKETVNDLIREVAEANDSATVYDMEAVVCDLFNNLSDTLGEMKGKNKVMPDRFLMVETIFSKQLDEAMSNLNVTDYEKYRITSSPNDVSGNKANNNQNINKAKKEEKEEYRPFKINRRPMGDVSDNEVSTKISINEDKKLLEINKDFFEVFEKGVKAKLDNKGIGESLAYAVNKSVDALIELDKLLLTPELKQDSTRCNSIGQFREDLCKNLELIDETLKEFSSNITRTKAVYGDIAKIDNSAFNMKCEKRYKMVASKNIFDLEEKQNAIDLVYSPARLFESVFEVKKSVESLITHHK